MPTKRPKKTGRVIEPAPQREIHNILHSIALTERLNPSSFSSNDALLASARKYALLWKEQRMGRSPISRPQHFESTLRYTEKVTRRAMAEFNSPKFQAHYKSLPKELQREVRRKYLELLKVYARLRQISRYDRVQHQQTPAVLNKRGFEEQVQKRYEEKYKGPFSVGLVDLDFFGKVNKRFGQEAGDAILQFFTQELSRAVHYAGGFMGRMSKERGFAGRVGGEEFRVYLPLEPVQMQTMFERLRSRVNTLTRPQLAKNILAARGVKPGAKMRDWQAINFTAGVAGGKRFPTDLKPYFEATNQGLIKGKEAGRARTVIVPVRVRK